MPDRPCPACHSIDGNIIVHLSGLDFDNSPLPLERDLVQCSKCGFLFCSAPYTETLLFEYYTNYYQGITSNDQSYRLSHLLDRKTSLTDTLLNHCCSKPVEELIICDVGCGRGELLENFYRKGARRLYGIDPGSFPEDVLSVRKFKTINSSFTDFKLPEKADIVISTHVFEHLLNITSAIRAIADNITDNGTVYIEVPDSEITSGQGVMLSNYLPEHINMFTACQLCRLLRENGFVPLAVIKEKINFCASHILGVIARYRSMEKGIDSKENPNLDQIQAVPRMPYKIDIMLKNYVHTSRTVYIWGITNVIFQLAAYSALKDCRTVFIDKSTKKQKHTIHGKPVNSPGILYDAPDDSCVVIGSYLRGDSIVSELKEMNYPGEIINNFYHMD